MQPKNYLPHQSRTTAQTHIGFARLHHIGLFLLTKCIMVLDYLERVIVSYSIADISSYSLSLHHFLMSETKTLASSASHVKVMRVV